MEHENLEHLKSFLIEELYLIPGDLKKLEEELQDYTGADSKPFQVNPKNQPSNQVLNLQKPELSDLRNEITPEPIPVKGDFMKGILILHEESELSPEILDMLVKMINACGHSMTDVGLVSSDNLVNRSMEDFISLNSHVVLKFGRIKHPVNALPARNYEIFTDNETEYLFADSLTEIAEDKTLKRKLWTSLQKLFNLT